MKVSFFLELRLSTEKTNFAQAHRFFELQFKYVYMCTGEILDFTWKHLLIFLRW